MNKRYYRLGLLAFLLSSFVSILNAQEQPSLRMRANQLFERYEYANAAALYTKIVDSNKPRTADMERLAASYMYINSYDLAENWYARIVATTDYAEASLWNYAEVLKQNGKYAEAKNQYKNYADKYGESDRVSLALAGADSAERWMAEPSGHKLTNEQAVNTSLSEFGALPMGANVFYAGEPMTVLGSRSGMTGEAYLRIYSAKRNEGEVGLHQPNIVIEEFSNAEYHVGPIAVNASGTVCYVTRTYSGSDLEKHRQNGHRFKRHNLELKIYTRSENSWQEQDFPYNNVKEYSLGHASISEDGETLYYASDMPGGRGGVDIWYSELQADGTWGAPQNAGSEINSERDEMFPNIVDGTLYFSSDGFAGMGGLDIFSAQGEKASFKARQNMRYPINSAADDFAFTVEKHDNDEVAGYLASNRKGGVGGDDIYSFDLRKRKVFIRLEGLTYNKKTNELLPEANVTLYGEGRQIVSRKKSGDKADFYFEINENTAYSVLAQKERFHADSVVIAALRPTKDTIIRVSLRLEPITEVGKTFVLEDIYYDFDKHNIRKDAAIILDQVVGTMRDNPTLEIELSSHTDSRGSDAYNMALSQRRADAAVEYIISRGIARSRIVAKGYGESRLVNKCSNGVRCTVAEHQANRRTEIKILKY